MAHQADDSLLIDITPVDKKELSPSKSVVSDDVPLCIGDNVDTELSHQKPPTHSEPLLQLADAQQNVTLNLLIQTQNDPVAPLLSPPPRDLPVSAGAQDSRLPLSSSPETTSSVLASGHFESFLSYLDDSVDHVTSDPDKPGQVLLEEVDSVIEEAEIKVRKRKESQTSTGSAEAISQFDTGKGGGR